MNVLIDLPPWAVSENANLPESIKSVEERMRAVIRFSELNVQHQTGGPFAAGVFETKTGKPVIIGVNRVTPLGISSAHAEIVTLMLAQTKSARSILVLKGCPSINWSSAPSLARCATVRFLGPA